MQGGQRGGEGWRVVGVEGEGLQGRQRGGSGRWPEARGCSVGSGMDSV